MGNGDPAHLCSSGVSPKNMDKSHPELCQDELCFTDHGVYMSGRPAHLEMELCALSQATLTDAGFEMVTGPDFTRSVVVEGCHPASDLVQTASPDLAFPVAAIGDFGDVHGAMGVHLVGSASLYPFVG